MKITNIQTLALSRMHEPERQWVTASYRTIKADCAIVVVETDDGVTGIGEASAYGAPLQIADWVDWLSPDLIGRDPAEPDIAPRPVGGQRAHDAAAAGIDTALWDLRGRIEGKSLCELLGAPKERYADGVKIQVYASSGCRYDWGDRPEQLIDEALDYVDQGFPAMKFRIGTTWDWDKVTVDRFVGLVRELHQAVNGRMDLALDGNCRLTEEQAMPIALELDRLGFAWLEEPIPRDQIDGYCRLNQAVEMPVTGGEVWRTVPGFRGFIDSRAVDIIQPDVGFTGVTEFMRIARFAESRGICVIPHSWHNGLMGVAHAHLVSALQEPIYVELCMIQGPLQWAILDNPPPVEKGSLTVPATGGLGVELAADLEQKFPHVEGHYAIQVGQNRRRVVMFSLGQRNGRCCFMTPDGTPFFSVGINHVDSATLRYPESGDVWRDTYGNSAERWLARVRADLTDWGFNTLGWVQEVVLRGEKMHRHSRNFIFEEYQWVDMPYCHMLPFSEVHQWEFETRLPDVTGPDFEEWCDYVARGHCARFRDDPKLIGYFYSDCPTWVHTRPGNEWRGPLFDPDRLASPGGRRELEALAKSYYRVTHDAIRRYDPQHLILGDRYEANADLPEEVVQAALPYVDVLSFQCFGTRQNIRDKMTRWASLGRPVLLADAAGFEQPHTPGDERHQDVGHYTGVMRDLLQIPECVGYHLCGAYLSNGVRRYGFKDAADQSIGKMIDDFREANRVVAHEVARLLEEGTT